MMTLQLSRFKVSCGIPVSLVAFYRTLSFISVCSFVRIACETRRIRRMSEKEEQKEDAAAVDAQDEDDESKSNVDDDDHQSEGERVKEKSSNEEEDNTQQDEEMDEITVDSESQQQGGDSPTEEKKSAPPPPFEAINPKTRASVHDKLRAYESRRRTTFQSKLESSSLYWRSFRDLLQSSVHETARAERLILGTARAHRSYAQAMQASYEDGFLDKRGQVVLDPKRQKRLAEQRGLEGNKTAQPMALTAEERKANMLTSIMEAQLSLSKQFGENAQEMEDEIATEVTKQRVELEQKVAGIRVLGDAILLELEQTEAEVSEAWESYYTIADKVLGGNSNRISFSSDDYAGTSPDTASPSKSNESCMDVWVVEMQYRVAVSYQSSVWEKASTELSTLFSSMKETECQRRIDLREYLLAFEQRQERLFLNLPDIYTAALKDLVGRDIDRNTIEEKVQFSIRKRAELLQRQDAKNKPPPEKGAGLENVDVSLASSDEKLDSPLMSELLCKAKVVDRKVAGMMGGWKTTLAVVTADSFLHLFDLPPGQMTPGSAPEVAFRELAPRVQVPTAETMRSGKTHFVRGWCDNLVPTDSLALHNCNVTSHGTIFDVQETIESRGASKMFGKTTMRKVTLRAVTEEETEDWMEALTRGYI